MVTNKYLLDTSACIAIIKGNTFVRRMVLEVGKSNCYVSEMTIAELFYGAAKSGKEKHYQDIQNILGLFEVVPVYTSLRTYGITKATLEKKGQRIDEMDLLIGSTALYNQMTIITHNTKHMNRIPGIKIEDWEMLGVN